MKKQTRNTRNILGARPVLWMMAGKLGALSTEVPPESSCQLHPTSATPEMGAVYYLLLEFGATSGMLCYHSRIKYEMLQPKGIH